MKLLLFKLNLKRNDCDLISFSHHWDFFLSLSSEEKKRKENTDTNERKRLLQWKKNPKEIWDYMHAFDVWYSLCVAFKCMRICVEKHSWHASFSHSLSSFWMKYLIHMSVCWMQQQTRTIQEHQRRKHEFHLIEFPFLRIEIFYEFNVKTLWRVAWKK